MAIKQINKNKFQVSYYDEFGMKRRKIVVGSKTLAKEVENDLKVKVSKRKIFPERYSVDISFMEAAEKYWNLHLSKKKSADKMWYTIEFLKKHFGSKRLSKITTENVQEFYNQRLAETTSSTANRHLTVLNAIINKALKLKLYKGENPCLGIVKEKENPPRLRYLEKEQIREVLTLIPERSRNLVAFAVSTGMRQGEILRVAWQDIDFVNNIIHINEAKSGYRREVPIMPALRTVLLNMQPQPSGKVFHLSVKQVTADFNHALKQAGITGICFHSCRHTFASHFMMNGGRLTDLQRILGHSDIKMTQRYAHLSPTYLRQSIEVVNDLIPQLQQGK